MVVKPFGSRVFVELEPVGERKTAGGVYIPDKHAEPSRFGKVLAVGPAVKTVSVGDKIMLSYYTGTGIDYLGSGFHYDTHRFIEESEILGSYEL